LTAYVTTIGPHIDMQCTLVASPITNIEANKVGDKGILLRSKASSPAGKDVRHQPPGRRDAPVRRCEEGSDQKTNPKEIAWRG